ncbi:SusC/RagA family TonB-linked outer membrane protein, partial [Mariniphaga sediminis]|uniref:SusC/RagA family TonB-linked outer membrane protein n=1 Tax=Mariniphaga sediminis TaxID=1628158 RepID=UPI0035661506
MFKLLLGKKVSSLCLLFGILILVFSTGNIQAQNDQTSGKKITGTILDSESNFPIPGVNVVVKGTTNGTVTNMDGFYEITAKSTDVIVFTYIGYESQEVTVGTQTQIKVNLMTDYATLGEVVVIGYGVRKKEDLTGSVSTVTASELTEYPVLNAMQAVQGRAAGVDIQSDNGGEPGAPLSIRIRGNTSINASSAPLIVVDGFVGAEMPQPGDIESMQILKDASATAIYGSQGANGVIIVTTKKGRAGKMNVDFNTYYSFQKTTNKLDLLNADDFTIYQNRVRTNQGNSNPYVQGDYNTDWQDEIYREGGTQNYQLAFRGGTEKVNYYASATYFDQTGILINSGYKRLTFLGNVDAQITDKLNLGLNLTGGQSKKNGVPTQSDGSVTVGGDDAVSLAMRFAPDKGIYNTDGTFTTNDQIGDEVDNPYGVASARDDDTELENFRANMFLGYEIIEGLTFKTTFGLSLENEFNGIYMPRTLQVTAAKINGRAIMSEDKSQNLLSETYLSYNKEIGDGTLTLLGGYSYQNILRNGFLSEGTGTISDAFSYYGLYTATTLIQPTAGDVYRTEKEIQSQYARVNYDFSNRYLFTATIRRDGASNFAENHKYAIFPSGALGWRVSNENFMQGIKAISNLKLRFSY